MFDRKRAIAVLNANNARLTNSFRSQLEDVKPKGFRIFWQGRIVKPLRGKVDYYESEKAALKAIDRNCSFGNLVCKMIAEEVLGLTITNEWVTECPNYWAYFRLDLQWADYMHDDRPVSRSYRKESELTEEEVAIRKEREAEEDQYNRLCHGALTLMIKKWIADGSLEIREF